MHRFRGPHANEHQTFCMNNQYFQAESDYQKPARVVSLDCIHFLHFLLFQDGRIWKERRTSVTGRAKADLPVVKDASCLESRDGTKPMPNSAKRRIASSLSAPEHSIISLLEECNTSQDQAGN